MCGLLRNLHDMLTCMELQERRQNLWMYAVLTLPKVRLLISPQLERMRHPSQLPYTLEGAVESQRTDLVLLCMHPDHRARLDCTSCL